MDLLQLQTDPAAFREALLIDSDSGPKPFAELMNDWQRDDFLALDSAWRRAAGQRVRGEHKQRAWLERGRGHSKSSDVMTSATWAIFASRKKLSGVVCAVDRDQAALDRDHVSRLISLNPWLGKLIDVQQWRIVNTHTGSTIEIMASDVASSYGLLLDFAVCDEVTLWPKRDLFDSILSAAASSSCLLLCIGNAGFRDSWQWNLREIIRNDPAWFFSRLADPVATWITQANLDEQRRLAPSRRVRQAVDECVVRGAGGDALSEADIAAAFSHGTARLSGPSQGWVFVAGVDAGVSRDASALCVLAVRRGYDGHGQIRLAHTKLWRPKKGKKIDLENVERELLESHDRFKLSQINYDPWELRYLASRLQAGHIGKLAGETHFGKQRRKGLPLVEVPPTGKNLQAMASALLEAFADRRLELYEEPDLKRDLNRMRVVEKSYGFRIESPRDEFGHGDLGTSFQLALLAASELAAKRIQVAGAIDLTNVAMAQTPRANWRDRNARRVAALNAHEAMLSSAGSGASEFPEWEALMRKCGRR